MKQPETFECCYKGFLLVNECIGKVTVDKLIGFDWNYRQEQFENSAAGRAARAQQQAMAKQSANANKGEPVLKVGLVFKMPLMFLATTNKKPL